MYAKLYSRITESSLMEEAIETRYVFMALLAIADPKGYVVGTDVAIARRLNVPLDTFAAAMARLMAPDPNSNSREHEGRRIVHSDAERGYHIVNYVAYDKLRDNDERREYMRRLMAAKREKERQAAAVSTVSTVSNPLAPVSSVSNVSDLLAPTPAPATAPATAPTEDVGQIEMLSQPEAAPPRAAEAAPASQSDEEWLTGLVSDPAYQGIDVRREHAKMHRWCSERRKKPTRRRFINWLNRADRPLTGPTEPDHSQGF